MEFSILTNEIIAVFVYGHRSVSYSVAAGAYFRGWRRGDHHLLDRGIHIVNMNLEGGNIQYKTYKRIRLPPLKKGPDTLQRGG